MAQFDPRRQPLRFAPHLLTAVAALAVTALIWRVYEPAQALEVPPLDPTAVAALEAKAFVAAETRPGLNLPETVPVRVRGGESIQDAVERLGVSETDARAAAKTLARAGVSNTGAFQAAIATPRSGRGQPRLIGLTLRNGPASTLTVARTFDGALKLRELEETILAERAVIFGDVDRSFVRSAVDAGAASGVANKAEKLIRAKANLRAGDDFILVYDRAVTESGRPISTGELLFAQSGNTRFYAFRRKGKLEYFDDKGANLTSAGMILPIAGARLSSRFGFRVHPILRFRKMHTGVDFAAASGTPIRAPADGVVVEARRYGGYGNWIRVRLSSGVDVGFAHMSRYGAGMRPGVRVRQGQVIGYVGSTGMSTGPHLHYEAFRGGKRINPLSLRVTSGTQLTGAELAAFKAQKAKIDALVAKRKAEPAKPVAGQVTTASAEGLRPTTPALTRGR